MTKQLTKLERLAINNFKGGVTLCPFKASNLSDQDKEHIKYVRHDLTQVTTSDDNLPIGYEKDNRTLRYAALRKEG